MTDYFIPGYTIDWGIKGSPEERMRRFARRELPFQVSDSYTRELAQCQACQQIVTVFTENTFAIVERSRCNCGWLEQSNLKIRYD